MLKNTAASRAIVFFCLALNVRSTDALPPDPYVSGSISTPVVASVSTTKRSTTKPNHCGDSLCGKVDDKSHAKIWVPIAAIAGVGVAAGGVAAGVLAAQHKKKKSERDHSETSSHIDVNSTSLGADEKPASTPILKSLKDVLTTTSPIVLANALTAGQTNSNMISRAPLAANPAIGNMRSPAFKASDDTLVVRAIRARAAPPPKEAGSATVGWIIAGVVLCACVGLMLCSFLIFCTSRKKMRACTRHLFPVDVEEGGDGESSTEMSASSIESSMDPRHHAPSRASCARAKLRNDMEPQRLSASGSDVEDTPLLAEGSALPKFWTWLKDW